MTKYRLLITTILVISVNIFVFMSIAYNRSGNSERITTLTERELMVVRGDMPRNEDSGITLRLNWVMDYKDDWFGPEKLKELGFSINKTIDENKPYERYMKILPRSKYIVLEYDGPTWEEYLITRMKERNNLIEEIERREKPDQEYLKQLRENLVSIQNYSSRLVPIDAGSDPILLLEKYSDNALYIIVPATIRVRSREIRGERNKYEAAGNIQQILASKVNVSRKWRNLFEGIFSISVEQTKNYRFSNKLNGPPRYKVTLKFGRKFEPWIESISPL